MSPGRRRRSVPRGVRKLDAIDISKKLKVHKTTVYRWINGGVLRARKDKQWGVYTVTETELSRFRRKFQ